MNLGINRTQERRGKHPAEERPGLAIRGLLDGVPMDAWIPAIRARMTLPKRR